MNKIILDGQSLNVNDLYNFSQLINNPALNFEIIIDDQAQKKIIDSSKVIDKIIARKETVYSINTGFGKFAEVKIEAENLQQLQKNILLSHSCGVGKPLSREFVFSMWLQRLNVFCRGNSGIKLETVSKIIEFLHKGILAIVPSKGSVGASGDLAPAAHASLPLIGYGECSFFEQGKITTAKTTDVLKKFKLQTLTLGPKEGLCLINGTQLTNTYACFGVTKAKKLLALANFNTALAIESLRASHTIFSSKTINAKNQKGAVACAEEISKYLSGKSEIRDSHLNCDKVQDPYSLRCAPLVHGAIHDEIQNCNAFAENEINSSTDNPLIFADTEQAISCGNFHALYSARVCDQLATAVTQLTTISERRLALLMNEHSSQLPMFLTPNGGLNSGYMMAHVTSAALVSECKSLCFPASVDTIPTSADKEDHVSMGPIAGYKLHCIIDLAYEVLTIETCALFQALYLLKPMKSTNKIESFYADFGKVISPYIEDDRPLFEDFKKAKKYLQNLELKCC